MTTLITLNGKLYADRHKVVNHELTGIVGAVQESKVTTTAYCYYATSGFVPEAKDIIRIEKILASVFTLFGVHNSKDVFSQSSVGKLFYKIPKIRSSINATINLMLDNLKVFLAKRNVAGIIAINHRYAFCINKGQVTTNNTQELYTLGSGALVASILLHHGEPIDSVYAGLCGATIPTGAIYETYDPKVFDNGLWPPFAFPDFIGNVLGNLDSYVAGGDSIGTAEEIANLKHDVITLMTAFSVIARPNAKNTKLLFTKNLTEELLLEAISPERKTYQLYAKG